MHEIAAGTAGPGMTNSATPQPRLVRAAHEFEAQMMKELMKPLNRGTSLTGTDRDTEDDPGSEGALGEFASEALGRALSEQGGFGIASSIVNKLSPEVHQNGTIPVIGSAHANTGVKALK